MSFYRWLYLPSGAFIIFLLVQLRACRNMVVHHEQVGDGDQCLSNQFFRLIVSVDTGEDGAVGAGAVIQSEL